MIGTTRPASLGRIVLVRMTPGPENNNADAAPAVITRVFGGPLPDGSQTVNVRVFEDGEAVSWRTSISLYGDQAQADEAKPDGVHVGWWPPRV